jgi:hypothetical protein
LEENIKYFRSNPTLRSNLQKAAVDLVDLQGQTSQLFGPAFNSTEYIARHIGDREEFISNLQVIVPPDKALEEERDTKLAELNQHLCLAGLGQVCDAASDRANTPPPLPGDTGWVFVGYFKNDSGDFVEGPYVSVTPTVATRALRHFVEVGDTVTLLIDRPVVILDFQNEGVSKRFTPPTEREGVADGGMVDHNDLTGVTLLKGTQLIVRDLSTKGAPVNPTSALWIRIVRLPK